MIHPKKKQRDAVVMQKGSNQTAQNSVRLEGQFKCIATAPFHYAKLGCKSSK